MNSPPNDFQVETHEFRRKTDADIGALRTELSAHRITEAERDGVVLAKLTALEQKVDDLVVTVEGLVEMVNQGRGMMTFIRWMAALAVAGAAVWAWMVTHFSVNVK